MDAEHHACVAEPGIQQGFQAVHRSRRHLFRVQQGRQNEKRGDLASFRGEHLVFCPCRVWVSSATPTLFHAEGPERPSQERVARGGLLDNRGDATEDKGSRLDDPQ